MAGVAGVNVLVSLGIIKLLDASGDYLITRRLGAVVDLGAKDPQIRRTPGRQILDREDGPTLVVLLGGQAHR
jgi:hypothetical protein